MAAVIAAVIAAVKAAESYPVIAAAWLLPDDAIWVKRDVAT